MFRCDSCHTEYGGIRGIAAGTCPRCKSGKTAAPTPPASSTPDPSAFRISRLTAAKWSAPTMPLVGEIAQLDRTIRF
jgi:hypothetical protein